MPSRRPSAAAPTQHHHRLKRQRHRGERQRHADLGRDGGQDGHEEDCADLFGDPETRASAPGRHRLEQGGLHDRRILAYAYSADNCGQRPERRRRHPGRPEDVRRVRRLRRQRDHRRDRAEHAEASRPSPALPADLVTAQIEAIAGDLTHRRHEDRHARERRDRRGGGRRDRGAGAPAGRRSIRCWSRPAASGSSMPTASRPCASSCCRSRASSRRTSRKPKRSAACASAPRTMRAGCGAADSRDGRRRRHHHRRAWTQTEPRRRSTSLFDDGEFSRMPGAAHRRAGTHGTGCTYASAIAAGLALGRSLRDAAARAPSSTSRGAIAARPGIGHGRGPLNHFLAIRVRV